MLRTAALFGTACAATLAAVGLLASASAHDMAGMPGMEPHHHHDSPATAEKLGAVAFPNACAARSQAGVVRGVALLHSFGYAKAEQQFEAVAKADPDCAIAHWGVAMSRYHSLWDQPDAADLTLGREAPALAQDGLSAARRYARIAPASPHALHMPAHIFARLGLWDDDIASNLASVAASRAAMAAGQPGGAHQMHADEFLIYAYLQTGQVAKAEALTAKIGAIGERMAAMPGMDDMKDGGPFFDSELRAIFAMETHRWTRLAALRPEPGAGPEFVFNIYWGRGVAAGRLHDPKLAAAALADYDRSMEAVKASPYAGLFPSPEIKRNEMLGWKALAEDRPDDAVAAMRRAADQQDKLGQGEVDIPAREMLGDLLLLERRPGEALTEYRTALKLSPNRLNGLRNAARAARDAGLAAEARRYKSAAARQTRRRTT